MNNVKNKVGIKLTKNVKQEEISPRNFMKPGKDNREDRLNFVKFWANYVKNHPDEDWSEQQNTLINSQFN